MKTRLFSDGRGFVVGGSAKGFPPEIAALFGPDAELLFAFPEHKLVVAVEVTQNNQIQVTIRL